MRDIQDWQSLQLHEAPNGLEAPPWQQSSGWDWTLDEEDEPVAATNYTGFIASHIQHAQSYLTAHPDNDASGTSKTLLAFLMKQVDNTDQILGNLFITLHLILEEQKLDVMMPEFSSPGVTQLRLLLAQIARWLKWYDFAAVYDLGLQQELGLEWENGMYSVSLTENSINPAVQCQYPACHLNLPVWPPTL